MDRPLVYNPNIDLNERSSRHNMSNKQGNGFNNTNFERMQNSFNDMQNISSGMQHNSTNMQHNFSGMQNNFNDVPSNFNGMQYQNNLNYYDQPMNMEHFIKKNKKNHFTNIKKCNNFKTFLRKVVVMTLLYVIISHKKMSLLLCNNIPYTCINYALTYNVIKGIIFGTVIYFTYNYM